MGRKLTLIVLVLAVLLGCVDGGVRTPSASGPVPAAQATVPLQLSIRQLAERPGDYLNKSVKVSGTLVNQGKNYFTDLLLVLKDDESKTVYVKPWLPASLPPAPPGRGGNEKRPEVLTDYLNKKVELTAVVQKGELRRAGDVYYLEVHSARRLP
jgi:hypothetical protein